MPTVVSLSRACRPVARSRRNEGTRSIVGYVTLSIDTNAGLDFVDITSAVSGAVSDVGLVAGIVTVQTRHTTTGILVNEHEPLLFTDLEALFERLAPAGADYAHDDFSRRTVNLTPKERTNGHAHCRAALLRTSESLTVIRGQLHLGRWQRIFLVEFDGAQRREVSLTMLGAGTKWTGR
jgi:secondary thiamine-phosphate synthase enzyme